jgi:hypothetical protein
MWDKRLQGCNAQLCGLVPKHVGGNVSRSESFASGWQSMPQVSSIVRWRETANEPAAVEQQQLVACSSQVI